MGNIAKITKRSLTKTYHIIFDALGCNKKKICDERFICKLLIELPKVIGSKVLSGPDIVRDYNPDNSGITGTAIISFSHISIHTFDRGGQVFVDIFSCQPIDYEKVRRYLFNKLRVVPDQVQTQEVKYPWEE